MDAIKNEWLEYLTTIAMFLAIVCLALAVLYAYYDGVLSGF